MLLKPSSLSQHTTDFNKILEQVPVPKIESFDLIKPTLESRINPGAVKNLFTNFMKFKKFKFGTLKI